MRGSESNDTPRAFSAAACLRAVRRQRWPDGVTCLECESSETISFGTTAKGARRYQCQACDRTFNDLTGTVFGGRQLSLPEMCRIIWQLDDGTPVVEIARRLDHTYKTIRTFGRAVQTPQATGDRPIYPRAVCAAAKQP